MGGIGMWKTGRSCAENSIRLYTDLARNPCPRPFLQLSPIPWVMYPATSTLSLNSCTYVTMSINPNPRMTTTFSVQQYLIQAGQPKRIVGRRTSYISDTLSWISRMANCNQKHSPSCFRTSKWWSPIHLITQATNLASGPCCSPTSQ